MARDTKASTIRRRLEVTPYGFDNEVMNRLMDADDTVWIVQGSFGRVPVLADTAEDAKDRYVEKYAKAIEAETDEEDEEVLESV